MSTAVQSPETQSSETEKKTRTRKPLPEFPTVGFVRLPQLLKVFPLGRSTFLNGVKEGRYPKPVKIGPKAVAWKVEDILALIDKLGRGE